MAENPLRVQAKVNELNLLEAQISGGFTSVNPQISQVWRDVPGFFAVTGFSNDDGKPIFNPSFGVTVKVFTNTRTGEIKMFSSKLFE